MKSRNAGRMSLGFQWNPGSWEDAPLWFDTLFRRIEGQRVHWNLPALSPDMPVRRRAAIVKPLKSRIESSGDLVSSMGYAGACHPLLNLDELEKELTWGLKNPWGTGVTDIFDVRPSVLVPQVPDLLRPDAGKLYRVHGYSLVGVCRDPWTTPPERPSQARTLAAGWFSVVRVRVSSLRPGDSRVRSLRRLESPDGGLFLLLDLTDSTTAGILERTLDELAGMLAPTGGPTMALLELPPTGALPADAPPWWSDWTPFTTPLLHSKLAATAALARKKRKRAEVVQDILARLGPREMPDNEKPTTGNESPNSLRLVAHMLGDVILAGTSFDVCLSGGRFCGLTRQGRDLVPRFPALSTLRLSGKTLAFRTASSFSFEGESGTGLREELVLRDSAEAGISIEYSFRDESPRLSISGEIRCPRFPESSRVDEYAPLVIALRELARRETVEILAAAPDGSSSAATVPADGAAVVLPGSIHRIRRADGGWIVLCYSCHGDGLWGIPSFRTIKHRRKKLLVANLFGSYAPLPASSLSGRREPFSLLLGLEDA